MTNLESRVFSLERSVATQATMIRSLNDEVRRLLERVRDLEKRTRTQNEIDAGAEFT